MLSPGTCGQVCSLESPLSALTELGFVLWAVASSQFFSMAYGLSSYAPSILVIFVFCSGCFVSPEGGATESIFSTFLRLKLLTSVCTCMFVCTHMGVLMCVCERRRVCVCLHARVQLYVCMFECLRIYACLICVRTSVYEFMCMYLSAYLFLCKCACVCIYSCFYGHKLECACMCLYVHSCILLCVCVCAHACRHMQTSCFPVPLLRKA